MACWRHPAELEPPIRPNGKRDFRYLTGLLAQPLALLDDRDPAKPVYHCEVRAAPGDPELGDDAWMRIAGEIMHRTGLSRYGEEDEGVRWVAVHHCENHIHIVAILARQDGRRARLDNDWYRISEALRDLEAEYGLRRVRPGPKQPGPPEKADPGRAGESGPGRAARAAPGDTAAPRGRRRGRGPDRAGILAALDEHGLRVRLRHNKHDPGELTVYAVGLPGDLTAAGDQIFYGGGKLASELTLPKLRRRWSEPDR